MPYLRMPCLAGKMPGNSSALTTRLLEAHGVVLGKMRMHELAMGGTSINVHGGPVLNPYNNTHHVGGSSGGTTAAVAMRLAPAGFCSDTGAASALRKTTCTCGDAQRLRQGLTMCAVTCRRLLPHPRERMRRHRVQAHHRVLERRGRHRAHDDYARHRRWVHHSLHEFLPCSAYIHGCAQGPN